MKIKFKLFGAKKHWPYAIAILGIIGVTKLTGTGFGEFCVKTEFLTSLSIRK